MNSLSPNIVVVVEGSREGRWQVHANASLGSESEEPIAPDSESLCLFARSLTERSGGPLSRAIVFISPHVRECEPAVLARYPQLIGRLSTAQALAHAAGERWDKFLVVEGQEGCRLSLMLRARAGFVEQRIATGVAGAARIAHELQIEHCLVSKCSKDAHNAVALEALRSLKMHFVGQDELLAGAQSFASALLAIDGISVNGRTTEVRSANKVKYSVFHPVNAVFDPLDRTLSDLVGSRPVLLVSDANVGARYAGGWRRYAERHLRVSGELLLSISERSKNWAQVHDICALAASCSFPRDGVIVGIGGGVTLDVAGFAASVFRRGVDYIRIPTTLLGLVDVAVGIKQGVNAYGKKNLLGTFYPPLASINDYRFVQTLDLQEISCGMAEIIKMALLRDSGLLTLLEQHGRHLLLSRFSKPSDVAKEVVLRAELLMLEELTPNLFERDLARLVDFGHTFGPLIENSSGFEIPHGYAVGLDMLLSTALAVVLGIADSELLSRLTLLLQSVGIPVCDADMPGAEAFRKGLNEVRQHRGGSLNLVVVSGPGSPHFLQSVSQSELSSALAVLRNVTMADPVGAA